MGPSEIKVENSVNEAELSCFLKRVDRLFPVPLSEKTDIDTLTAKLVKCGTLSCVKDGERVIALCAGYTNDNHTRLGYVSVVACLPEYANRGYGQSVVRNFVKSAKQAGMRAVHLYAVKDNHAAIHMYEKCGFVDWLIDNEPRLKDRHLIYWII